MPPPEPRNIHLPASQLDARLFVQVELVGIGLMSAAVYYTEADGNTNVWAYQTFDNRQPGPYLQRLGRNALETTRQQHLRRYLIIVQMRNPDTRSLHFTVTLRLGMYDGGEHKFFDEVKVFDEQLPPKSEQNVSEELQFIVI